MASSLILLTTQAKTLDDPLPCHRENPQLWFSDLPADLQLAKAYCQPCPVRRACLSGAVERGEPTGSGAVRSSPAARSSRRKGHAAGRPEEQGE